MPIAGVFGTADLASGVLTTMYSPPAGLVATVTVSLCNRGAAAAAVSVALAANPAAPANGEWVEYGTVIPVGGVLERSGVVLGHGSSVVAKAASAGISCVVFGFEEVQP